MFTEHLRVTASKLYHWGTRGRRTSRINDKKWQLGRRVVLKKGCHHIQNVSGWYDQKAHSHRPVTRNGPKKGKNKIDLHDELISLCLIWSNNSTLLIYLFSHLFMSKFMMWSITFSSKKYFIACLSIESFVTF